MSAVWIAVAELRMLVRNKLVAASALLVPLFFAVLLIVMSEAIGGVAANAALIVISVAAVGVYITATTTLAGRRETLYLKRLRTTIASDAAILVGMVIPIVLVNIVQIAIVLTVLAVLQSSPARPLTLALGVVLFELLTVGLAMATSARTRSPEHAQITTMPLFFVLFGVGFWVAVYGTSQPLLQWSIPGGATTELLVSAWGSGEVGETALLAAVTAAWALVGFAVGLKWFRWEPRR